MAAILTDAGYHVLGPLHSSTDGIEAISTFRPDAALLDVRLARGTSLLLAEELERQNIPFALVSGATRRMIAARYRNRPFLAKPFGTGELAPRSRSPGHGSVYRFWHSVDICPATGYDR